MFILNINTRHDSLIVDSSEIKSQFSFVENRDGIFSSEVFLLSCSYVLVI